MWLISSNVIKQKKIYDRRKKRVRMNELAFYDRKDYDLSFSRLVRNSVRAIIIKNQKIALIYENKHGLYVFPGGSIEDGETHLDALIRETKEEAGLIVKPHSVKEFGSITEIRKDIFVDGIYEQRDYYYTCDVEDVVIEQNLTDSEKDIGYQLKFVSLNDAILLNETDVQAGRHWVERETFVLNLLRNNLMR